MKIVIIGDGKVGHKLTTELADEDYDIVSQCSDFCPGAAVGGAEYSLAFCNHVECIVILYGRCQLYV